ncbi:hypothetical protein IWZ01DRAFT_174313 [Phyllosticta capitalensis]
MSGARWLPLRPNIVCRIQTMSQRRQIFGSFASKIEPDMRPKKALFTLKALRGAGLAKVPAACAASLAVQSLLGPTPYCVALVGFLSRTLTDLMMLIVKEGRINSSTPDLVLSSNQGIRRCTPVRLRRQAGLMTSIGLHSSGAMFCWDFCRLSPASKAVDSMQVGYLHFPRSHCFRCPRRFDQHGSLRLQRAV